jgi:acetyl-CoA C-acetyltransferase
MTLRPTGGALPRRFGRGAGREPADNPEVHAMPGSVIVAGARTPIGKLSGSLGSFPATELGGFAIAAALERAALRPDQVDYVLMGQVILAGTGQITARQAAASAGIPMSVPATTVNKVCLSGLNTIYLADQMIRAGDAEIVVAGGMESMTQAPHLVPGARAGFRIGDGKLVDSMMFDGLTCAFDQCAMGLATERYNQQDGHISRERQDAFAAASHEKAAAAAKDGRLAEEIVAVSVPQRKGDPLLVDTDEGVRPGTTPESLGALAPAFDKEGTLTAGNASQISDGGSAVIVMSTAKAEQLGCSPLGELVSYGQVAGPDTSLLLQPSRAIAQALGKADKQLADVEIFEINEAFAAVGLASADDLGIPEDRLNVNGGAIALGHPVGMSGNRLALTALLELKRRGGGLAAVALCGGGGQGDAALLRSLA